MFSILDILMFQYFFNHGLLNTRVVKRLKNIVVNSPQTLAVLTLVDT